ncbi:TonB-dependent receptor [Microbulbifer sp. HZ11]|uniref:TonB-dependent receptor n=1 Tax=Microbulbifer sp. HZ11 TaxID=1453501 RepID=UPI0005BAB36B|nr:TonB-dependent receptor [Microbulbifer sp. HZ11]
MSTSTVRNRFRMSALSVAVLSACSGQALAQETEDPSQYEALEEVQVTGIRASIEKSIDDKRYGGNIKDTINAEDIGKTTDQNIAEALSRVTGVSMQTADGEGTTITVRGANAQQNNISLNGVQLGSTGFSQAVDLSAYSADILSKIEVVKTPSADHDEGSLGANINLVSAKPLEVTEGLNITGQGRYNDLSEKEDHKASATFTGKFFDDTFGVIATAFDETNSVRKDQFSQDTWGARTSQRARDENGNIVNDVTGLVPYHTKMQLHENDRDRQGVNLGLQWQPNDDTEINANLSWNKQEIDNTMHEVSVRAGDYYTYQNMVEGDDYLWLGIPSEWTDPQEDWHTYDSESRTFTKYLNRNSAGDLTHQINKFTNENRIASVDFSHSFTDEVMVSGGLNYSKAEEIPDQALYVNMQNYRRVNAWLVRQASPEELEPVGFDCSSGKCNIVAGTGLIDYGTVLHPDPGALWDNTSTTMFNPDDLEAQHLAYLARTVRAVEDTQQSAYFDVDWDVDFAGVHRLEFGAKASKREKYVDNQSGAFNSIGEGVTVIDPETGRPFTIVEGITDIDGNFIAEGSFPVDDFMQSLGYADNNVTDGWNTISAEKAFVTALNNPAAAFIPDDTETRSADLDTQAIYFKANFSFLDEALSGDVGLRYVNTTVDTSGYSGVNFYSSTGNLGKVLDVFKLQELRNSSNPACAPVLDYDPSIILDDASTPDVNEGNVGDPLNQQELRWSRLDGMGWDTKGTLDISDDTRIEAQGPCYDAYAERDNMNEWFLWRYSDLSTEQNYGTERDANGNVIVTEDRSNRSFAVTGEHEYDVLLPSLNLNYVFNDELIGRLALSKTMSRPQIDSLRPGFKVQETVWTDEAGRGNAITLTNTKLDPLESKNLDLSLEWYFGDNALLAAGLFYKEMTNFEESQTIITYMDDLRELGLDENEGPYDTADLIKTADDLEGCMPRRIEGTQEYTSDWLFSDDLADLCAKFQTTTITNGKGAEILGAEFQYTQTYDMLPGVFSGLGTMFNYTYQDSAYDQEVSSLDPSVTLPELPVAFTPEHSYNATVFWEMNGHQLRLAYQGTSDQLAQRSWESGSLWQEGRGTLDLSASYALNDNVTLSFNAVNLTDEKVRHYFTSRFIELPDENGNMIVFDEGNPLDGGNDSRTTMEYKTGTFYRFGVQARF